MTKEELYEEMRVEAYNDERLEIALRNDYDRFQDYHKHLIDELESSNRKLMEAHLRYGWEYNPREFI